MPEIPNFEHVRRGLKDFQLATVDYVFGRLYGVDSTSRFLVADEVGLGKTLVARGVIARAINHLHDKVARIDIVYVCSNAEIARQNIRRLNITGRDDVGLATRITLLPLELHQLTKSRLNFVSFTPGTSFDLGWSTGIARERALLLRLLRSAWKLRITDAALELMRDQSGLASFRQSWEAICGASINEELAEAFAGAVAAEDAERLAHEQPTLRERWHGLRSRFGHRGAGGCDPQTKREARELIGELRRILARSCVDALEPDLIILDEFQRFNHLLDQSNPVGELAQHLFAFRDHRGEQARVLMLSATPYKMLTVAGADDEDHYADFIRTYDFLVGHDANETADLKRDLSAFREALLRIDEPEGLSRAARARDGVEEALRGVMCRTERQSATPGRDDMLVERPAALELHADDVRGYIETHRLAEHVGGAAGLLEYWKSAPYLLEFMDGYDLIRRVERAAQSEALTLPAAGRLAWSDLTHYRKIDPANARLRWLEEETVGAGAARYLWMPPALPYHALAGPYANGATDGLTKRLVFSSWAVVPRAVAPLLSYSAEREMFRPLGGDRGYERKTRSSRLLEFALREQRPTGMPVVALVSPLVGLAREVDPRAIAAEFEEVAERPPSRDELLERVRLKIAARAEPLTRIGHGPPDERWYWLLPFALEADTAWIDAVATAALSPPGGDDEDSDSALATHLQIAAKTLEDLRAGSLEIGVPPDDLLNTTAQLIVAAPGIAAARALMRIAPDASVESIASHAAVIARGGRTLFNVQEVTGLIRGLRRGAGLPYWRLVLDYCVDGCLQSVLDEYAHVLVEHTGSSDRTAEERVRIVATEIHDALAIRTTRYRVRDFVGAPDAMTIDEHHLRGRFALRFGDDRTEDGGAAARAHAVRVAFNSPFWPFVLVSTSVGQEGLDFHLYCHAIVHWNLPANPVDMEQREGRIHRYKNHAVRKNVATAHRAVGLAAETDPWAAMFEAATEQRAPDANDLVPSWIYTNGDARIERYVPRLPFSREVQRLEKMRRMLAAYRLVFGQPRQEDLLEYLAGDASAERLATLQHLQIRLQPPDSAEAWASQVTPGMAQMPNPPTPSDQSNGRRAAPAPTRARPTYAYLPLWAVYGHTMKALAGLGGSATADEAAAYLAELKTPHGGEHDPPPGARGVGWYPASMAAMLRQVALHGYGVEYAGATGTWTLAEPRDYEEAVARAECYRLAAIDPRGPMESKRL